MEAHCRLPPLGNRPFTLRRLLTNAPRNFVKKFIGTVQFGNDHFGAIMGYGDYVIDLELAFRKHTCFRSMTSIGVDLIKGSRDYYESVGITYKKTVPRTPQQNCIVERRNHTLVKAVRTMLIFSKAPLFLWGKLWLLPVTTQNRSHILTLCTNKTTIITMHDKKPDLSSYSFTIILGSSIIFVHHGVATEHSFEVNLFAATEHEPFVNVFAPDLNSEASSSGILTITTPNQSTQPHEHLRKWTDSHPLDNIMAT
ncbi:retrovirus-related pol polyprotein from transposon TNT 1-94 [Tanacetum coccineum]